MCRRRPGRATRRRVTFRRQSPGFLVDIRRVGAPETSLNTRKHSTADGLHRLLGFQRLEGQPLTRRERLGAERIVSFLI